MAPFMKEDTRYDSLDLDVDLENDNDSETTLASDGFLGKNNLKRIERSEKSSRLQAILTWTRWSITIFLQGIIIMLLLPTSGVLSEEGWSLKSFGLGSGSVGSVPGSPSGWDQSKTETGGDVNGLYIPSMSSAKEG